MQNYKSNIPLSTLLLDLKYFIIYLTIELLFRIFVSQLVNMKNLNPCSSTLSLESNSALNGLPLCSDRVFFMEKPKLIEDLGMQYATPTSKQDCHYGMFECPFCGTIFKAMLANVKRGITNSCGCYNILRIKESNTHHGLTQTRIFKIWVGMRVRCNNRKRNNSYLYVDRGISVCGEWENDFMSFYNWSMANGYQENLEIDRINNNGNYCPENCRWATRSQNQQNTRLLNSKNKSGYRGVCKTGKRFMSKIWLNNKQNYLGTFDTAEQAALAYNNWVIEHKTFHPLNIIPQQLPLSFHQSGCGQPQYYPSAL